MKILYTRVCVRVIVRMGVCVCVLTNWREIEKTAREKRKGRVLPRHHCAFNNKCEVKLTLVCNLKMNKKIKRSTSFLLPSPEKNVNINEEERKCAKLSLFLSSSLSSSYSLSSFSFHVGIPLHRRHLGKRPSEGGMSMSQHPSP